MNKALAISALNKAITIRQPKPGLIQHLDRRQYFNDAYCTLRKAHNIIPSMRGEGNYLDNAMLETVCTSIKAELIWHTVFQKRNKAIKGIGQYIDGFYTPVRRHSSFG